MKKFFYILITGVFLFMPVFASQAIDQKPDLAGRILLQVESHGEAWYVDPDNDLRYYLGRPYDAFQAIRNQGVGVSDSNIAKIPVGHTDPKLNRPEDEYTSSIIPHDIALAKKLAGHILLQVQSHGEAWYVYPVDLKRYYLGRPLDAFNVMRALGLGISDTNLQKIAADNPSYQIAPFEKKVFDLVNQERVKNGVKALKWNDEMAKVAREHSLDLANENKAFTGVGVSCNFPMIHHEGLIFGLYNNNRLNNRNIYYFDKSGENIALMPAARLRYTYNQGDPIINEIKKCEAERVEWDGLFETEIHKDYDAAKKLQLITAEIKQRTDAYKGGHELDVVNISWETSDQIAEDTVQGWMESPGHRKNMLDPDFDEGGMGTAYVNGYLITTQNFIRRTDCGFQTGACCEKEGYYPYCYEPLTCTNKICN